ncbi:GerAB/ArcD/ProY family transporter [Paenibacillus sp. FSL K6-0108]|uniref:GerAB/ArcD/ProY family transporter n=1 Tax=Paenibacillus sp. FSL K6-0108 TaxID=2921417 RepID=UPI00324489AE
MRKGANLGADSFLTYGVCVGTSALIPYSLMNRPQDQGVAIILGGIWILALFTLYRSILRFGDEHDDLFDLIRLAFGRVISKLMIYVYGIFVLLMIGKDLAIVWGTIGNMMLPKQTPQFVAALLVIHIFLICIQGGMKTILHLSVFFSTLCLLTNIVILVFSIQDIEANYFFPLFYEGWKPLFQESFSISTNSSGEIMLFLLVPQICTEIRTTIKRYLFPVLCIMMTNLIKYVVSVGFLGEYLQYVSIPGAVASGVLTIGNAQIRIESLVILAWFSTAIIKFSIEYYILVRIASKLTGNGNESSTFYLFPVGLIVWSITMIMFQNQLEIIRFPETYAIYATVFQIIIPVVLWVGLKLKGIIRARLQ